MPESRKVTEQIYFLEKTTVTSALRPGRSEVLRSLRHYSKAAGTKSRTSHHRSPGGERRRKGRSLTILLERRRKKLLSIRRALELFQRQLWETSEKRGGAQMDFSERTDIILK